MNLHLGKAIRITLPLAAAVLVAVMAVAFSFAPGVGADGCGDLPDSGTATNPTPVPDVHEDSEGDICGDADVPDYPDHDNSTTHAAISSTEPGAAVAIRLSATAGALIDAGDKITVDFSGPSVGLGFILPKSTVPKPKPIATDKVSIKLDNGTMLDPSDVLVQGERVILTVPEIPSGEYTITFTKAAGIKNPYHAGTWAIAVDDGDAEPNINTVVIRKMTTIAPQGGAGGDTFNISGKGYPAGTVTIFAENPAYDDAEILQTVVTGEGSRTDPGEFNISLTARNRPGNLWFPVWIKDSEGDVVHRPFRIASPTTSFEPSAVVAGETVRIVIEDWQHAFASDQGGIKGVAAVRISGEDSLVTHAIETKEYRYPPPPGAVQPVSCVDYADRALAGEDRVLSLEVVVPKGILVGEQTVSLYDYDQLERRGEDGNFDPLFDPDKMKYKPCKGGPEDRVTEDDEALDVRLKEDAIPLIQEIVRVISRDQAGDPDAPRGQNINDGLDGGVDRALTLHASSPIADGGRYLDEGDQIEITLPGFDLTGAIFDSQEDLERIKFSGSGDATANKLEDPIPDSSWCRPRYEQTDIDLTNFCICCPWSGGICHHHYQRRNRHPDP